MDGRRLATLWRAGVGVLAAVVLLLVLARLDAGLRDWQALGVLAVLFVVAVVVVVRTRPRPFTELTSRHHSDRERAAAVRRVMRAERVEPVSLRAEAVRSARRALWVVGMQALLQSMIGASWALQGSGDRVVSWQLVVGGVWLAFCVVLLAYLGSRRRRLDAVESGADLTPPVGTSP